MDSPLASILYFMMSAALLKANMKSGALQTGVRTTPNPDSHFHTCLIFAGKARAYPYSTPL